MKRKNYKKRYKKFTKEEKFQYKLENYIEESEENLSILNQRRRRILGGYWR